MVVVVVVVVVVAIVEIVIIVTTYTNIMTILYIYIYILCVYTVECTVVLPKQSLSSKRISQEILELVLPVRQSRGADWELKKWQIIVVD